MRVGARKFWWGLVLVGLWCLGGEWMRWLRGGCQYAPMCGCRWVNPMWGMVRSGGMLSIGVSIHTVVLGWLLHRCLHRD